MQDGGKQYKDFSSKLRVLSGALEQWGTNLQKVTGLQQADDWYMYVSISESHSPFTMLVDKWRVAFGASI